MIEHPPVESRPATLLERVTAAGISKDRARALITSGAIRCEGHEDGDIVDPDTSWPWPQRWCHAPSN